MTLQSPTATLIPLYPAQSTLGADILVNWIGKIVRICSAGGSRTLDFLRERRTPYPLGQALRCFYISQLSRFARVSSRMTGFSARNKNLTRKLLHPGYRCHKLRKAFSKFYRGHYELVSKFRTGLKSFNRAYRNRNFMVTWSIN